MQRGIFVDKDKDQFGQSKRYTLHLADKLGLIVIYKTWMKVLPFKSTCAQKYVYICLQNIRHDHISGFFVPSFGMLPSLNTVPAQGCGNRRLHIFFHTIVSFSCSYSYRCFIIMSWYRHVYEPRHKKTGLLHMRKQRRRSAVQ